MIVTERELDAFRREHLSSTALLRLIETFVWVLLRLGIGVGKSWAVDGILRDPATFARFDLVLYFTQSWDVLRERPILAGHEGAPVSWATIDPRPIERCGPYAERWAELEKRGCSTFAKATLCRECMCLRGPCPWPAQYKRLREHQLIFAPDQHLVLNRGLVPFLRMLTKAVRVLVILDEAKVLDGSFEVRIAAEDLRRLREVIHHLARPKGVPSRMAQNWCQAIDDVLAVSSDGLRSLHLDLWIGLFRRAFKIQKEGIARFGDEFRYVAFELALLQWSRPEERWKDAYGTIHFVARPYLGCHLLILSAHLSAAYVSHRLGQDSITSPFERTQFIHTGTRIFNLRSRIGAETYFLKNSPQILDTFAVLIRRNVLDSRTTLLVTRKKFKAHCAEYLRERLAGWGIDVRFVVDDLAALPAQPDPRVIPVLHYGVHGVNDFTEYESAYCLNGYYVRSSELERHVQEHEPTEARVKFVIAAGPNRIRRVDARLHIAALDWQALGNLYLRKMEVDPVVQAVGRVRFLTRPREVVTFAMHDLSPEVGPCRDVRSLGELREALGIPEAKEIDQALEAERIARLRAEGRTSEEIAAELKLSRRTLFRRVGGSAKSPTSINSSRVLGTGPDAPKPLEDRA